MAIEALGVPSVAVRDAIAIASAPPSARAWTRFLTQALLSLGAGLVLSGIVCFFAFNWENLGRFAKLGLLQLAIAACALVAWWRLRDLVGRVALAAAAVLVGPLLGVFGQTYQTGADPWGLFAAWAVLIAPWVIVSHFTALWMLEIGLVDLALTLFWMQVPDLTGQNWMYIFPLLASVHAIAVALWESQRLRVQPWLDEKWAPRLLVAILFGLLLAPVTSLVFDLGDGSAARTLGALALAAAIGVAFMVYKFVREDLFMLTVAGGSVLIVITMVVGRVMFQEMKLEMGGMLLMAMFILGEVAVGVSLLRRSVRGEAE